MNVRVLFVCMFECKLRCVKFVLVPWWCLSYDIKPGQLVVSILEV